MEALESILAKLENIERRIDLIDSTIKSYQQNTCSNLPPICTNDAVTEDVGMDVNETIESLMGLEEEAVPDTMTENVHNEDSCVEDFIVQDSIVENAGDDALANEEIQADTFQESEIQNQENNDTESASNITDITEAVIDRMKPKLPSWKTDMPGYRIEDVNDGISLNDRIFLLTELFSGDAELFKETLSIINGSDDFEQFESYVYDRFPDWNMESEAVYRLMMLARRRLS